MGVPAAEEEEACAGFGVVGVVEEGVGVEPPEALLVLLDAFMDRKPCRMYRAWSRVISCCSSNRARHE
jgi:hypothetical protein